ncbi:hypothetical protein [Pseudoxanthomonas sp. SGT-18]|uniref:hypothetical protein n=1 Tax=Pseudoxanthomonas sp. SGT-18 TaxID=2493087 RepID=UPI000F628962|nr:hypothetical protein [Pseudoxanthomonas sp. SGT-18]
MIQSFMVHMPPNDDGHVFLILDTVFDHRHLFTACGVGRVERGDARLTETGRATLYALADYANQESLGTLRLVEIATVAAAPLRVRKALQAADDKDLVFFVCRSPQVYDAAIALLNVKAAASTDTGVQ